MALDITAVREALAAQINKYAYPALRTLAEPEDQINPPVGIVMPGRPYAKYGVVLEGATWLGAPSAGKSMSPTEFSLDILLVVAKASTLERVEAVVDQWLGMQNNASVVSVPAAIAVDPTLGGLVEWCLPVSADPPGPLEWSGPQAMGARLHLSLSAS